MSFGSIFSEKQNQQIIISASNNFLQRENLTMRIIHAAPEREISGTSISELVITKKNIQIQAEAFTESLFTIFCSLIRSHTFGFFVFGGHLGGSFGFIDMVSFFLSFSLHICREKEATPKADHRMLVLDLIDYHKFQAFGLS
jgi:hypothetical protein